MFLSLSISPGTPPALNDGVNRYERAAYLDLTISPPVATPSSIVNFFVRMAVETDHTFIMRVFYVNIHTNKHYERLYTGMTNHLVSRSRQYKSKQIKHDYGNVG